MAVGIVGEVCSELVSCSDSGAVVDSAELQWPTVIALNFNVFSLISD